MSEPSVISCNGLSKSYQDGNLSVEVLKNINFSIDKGERIAIIGPSGSGKSTLLHLLGGLDRPSSGQVLQYGVDWQSLKERQRCKLRNQRLGFVYQFHYLLPEFSALENIVMPLLLAGAKIAYAKLQALAILEHIGLSTRAHHKPAQLSGGERQRVAIARALVHQPQCVLADEPTGNLDQITASKVFDMMLDLNVKFNTALVIVTHDIKLAERMDKIVVLQDANILQL